MFILSACWYYLLYFFIFLIIHILLGIYTCYPLLYDILAIKSVAILQRYSRTKVAEATYCLLVSVYSELFRYPHIICADMNENRKRMNMQRVVSSFPYFVMHKLIHIQMSCFFEAFPTL